MSQQVEIQAAGYRIVLTARSLDELRELVRRAVWYAKEGEALVEALLAVAATGISKTDRFKDGRLNDGANGEPAVQGFNGSGGLVLAMRYKNDQLNDGANGAPAHQGFDASGRLVRAERYKDGKLVKTLDAAEIAAYREALRREQTIRSIEVALPALRFL